MLKYRSKKYRVKKKGRSVRKRFFGNIALIMVLVVAIALGTILVIGPKFEEPTVPAVQASSCLDYDPPSLTDVVMLNNVKYDAIKKSASIVDSKMGEMQNAGKLDGTGEDVYKVPGGNYFGEKIAADIIYVLRDQKLGYHYFDVYIKEGDPIPDAIKNSKSRGANGPVSIVVDDNTQFPPQGFDVDQIKNLTISISNPSYVYGDTKTTAQYVNNLKGATLIGSVATIKGNLPVYYHLNTTYIVDGKDAYEYIPSSVKVGFTTGYKPHEDLQLRKFTIKRVDVNPICWYTPECKPAIYLYPEKKTSVNVKVMPKGYFTYTKPSYPEGTGWQVTANPDGTIETNNALFDYLYYESNLLTSEIKVPTEGYVVAYDKLPELYDQLLPKLGLSVKELSDFREYWNRVLPKSPYYFVGIMDRENIDSIEQMRIVPQPTSVVRVRLYFEALKAKKEVKEPFVRSVVRPTDGFTVVEWGGMVKSDPNSPFTCSQ